MSIDTDSKLATIFIHPLKSAAGLVVDQALVAMEGLVGDRRYLVSTPDGTFISARSHPRLVLVKAEIQGDGLLLTAPGMPPLEYQRDKRHLGLWPVAVWKDRFEAFDCGSRVSAWISDFLGEELRFSWLGESRRPLRWNHDRRTTFADAAPLLAVSQASVDAVSAEAGRAVSVRRFRPNLVLEGVEAFTEDHWRRIRIGEVEFQMLDGCSRCELTTVDPDTGIKHPANEPVASLKRFRDSQSATLICTAVENANQNCKTFTLRRRTARCLTGMPANTCGCWLPWMARNYGAAIAFLRLRMAAARIRSP